jgi:uncharacterized protein YecE (DUF72 family)
VTVGTAGWAIGRRSADAFPGTGTHLERYARRLNGVEINSSFYRSHAQTTYARWRRQVPAGFRFAVKMPRAITHDRALSGANDLIQKFFDEVFHLGSALGPILVQLPPSLAYDEPVVATFFAMVRNRFESAVVCEPRHPSWVSDAASRALTEWRIGRVAADPPRTGPSESPGGWLGPAGDGSGAVVYYRLHGSPRIYWSKYSHDDLARWTQRMRGWPASADVWCIFDNTAAGGALENALQVSAGC